MGKLLLALSAITVAVLLSSYFLDQSFEAEADKLLFRTWMDKHGKHYGSQDIFNYRFAVFQKNAAYVRQHNARFAVGLESFDLELNLFADLENKEFAEAYTMKNFKVTKNCTGSIPSTVVLPDEVDWSGKGAVTPIKNQGQCGSCWAFSATGSLEGVNYLKNGNLASYSEQQLVDCSTSYGNAGCQGGLMDDAFYYVIDNGITLESKYPYKGVNGKCTYTASQQAFRISNCADVTVNKEASLQAAVAATPVSVAIEANHASFQLYKSGVYGGLCGTNLDHGVLAVGYGTDATSKKPYWKVKNSWGSTWGQSGYILILRKGDGKGECGINMAASIPLA